MRETPLGSPLFSHFSRGVRVNGDLCLGGTDSLLWPLRALQGGDDQDLRSFCFRSRGFAPTHNAPSRAEGQSRILPLSSVHWLLHASGMEPRAGRSFFGGTQHGSQGGDLCAWTAG